MFNPNVYIQPLESGYVLCSNPVADGGLSSLMVDTKLSADRLKGFQDAIKRMVLGKLFSPKFAEVILLACEQHRQPLQQA
jgi:hypothetical protein